MAEQRNDRKVVFPSEESAKDIPASSSAELNELQSSAECNVEERRGESSQQLVEWDDPMAVEMEQLLIPLIKEASRTAIKKITECGCSEEEAEWAVLTSGVYQGYMDLTNNIVNGAFALLEYTNGFDTSIRPLFDDLESLAGYILLEMVSVMKETKPFLSVGEAMWLLLLFELNILHAVVAATPNLNPNPNPTGADPQPSQLSHVSGSGKKVPRAEKGGKGSKGKRLSKTKIATPVVKTPGNIPASSSGVPVSEKDGMIASLMQRKQQLQKEVQGWIDWTNVKVGQATRKLSMDQAELRMLRKEIQFEENIIKRRCELQDALSHLGAQIDAINSAHFEVMAERSKLMEGIAESRLNFVDSCIDLHKSKSREEELQKQRRTLEVEMSSLQGELAALKGNSADLQANIDKARKGQSKFERNELQKESNLFECFEHMHKKKNGAFVDERSKRIVVRRNTSTRHDVAMQEAEGSTKIPIINMSQLYVDGVGGVKKQRIYDLGTKASSFISENSSSSSATSQFHQAAMKEMLNQQLESMQAEMEAKLQAERAQMQAQIASLMDELHCNGMLSTSMPRPPTTEAEHSINSNDENL
nr:putative E3 ubiquitin-protein ligase RF298 isoform X2 [Ipomoea batatas]